jgi:hypothetical protein
MLLLLFIGHLITGSIDPAPKVRGGTFGTARPMSYAATFWIGYIVIAVTLTLVFGHHP